MLISLERIFQFDHLMNLEGDEGLWSWLRWRHLRMFRVHCWRLRSPLQGPQQDWHVMSCPIWGEEEDRAVWQLLFPSSQLLRHRKAGQYFQIIFSKKSWDPYFHVKSPDFDIFAWIRIPEKWVGWVLIVRIFMTLRRLWNVNMGLFQWIWFSRNLKVDSLASLVLGGSTVGVSL